MRWLAINSALALVWAIWRGGPDFPQLVLGFGLAYALLWLVHRLTGPGGRSGPRALGRYLRTLPQSLLLSAYFLKELVKSCLLVARDCVIPRPELHPAIVVMPIGPKSDLELFVLANLITLTPGTLTLDVAPDRRHLLIHSLYARDEAALIAVLKSGMEHRVHEVFRP